MARNLYEHYGGFATVSRLVMRFYDVALDSDVLADFFDDVDMRQLIDHQTKFVASLMGGPASYSDDQIKQIHAHLEIGNAAFDEMAKLFRETLEEFSLEPDHVEQLVNEITSRRDLIVTVR